jgi:two-component system OmpR family response regulator
MWILLIEDEARLRSSLKQGLEEGYVVDQAADGEAGLDEARAHGYDVLVVDWRLPRRDGRSVVEALREAGRAVPTSADVGTLHGDEKANRLPRLLAGGGAVVVV